MKRSLLSLALVTLLTSTASAAFVVTPPDGDDPTVAGWLLVKLPTGVGHPWQIQAEFNGVDPRETSFIPDAMTNPTIFANYAGPQFWLDDTEPTFILWEKLPSFGGWVPSISHNYAAEVAALDEVSVVSVASDINSRLRIFRLQGAGGYDREFVTSIPFLAPEPSGLVMLYYVGLSLIGGRSLRRQ